MSIPNNMILCRNPRVCGVQSHRPGTIAPCMTTTLPTAPLSGFIQTPVRPQTSTPIPTPPVAPVPPAPMPQSLLDQLMNDNHVKAPTPPPAQSPTVHLDNQSAQTNGEAQQLQGVPGLLFAFMNKGVETLNSLGEANDKMQSHLSESNPKQDIATKASGFLRGLANRIQPESTDDTTGQPPAPKLTRTQRMEQAWDARRNQQ